MALTKADWINAGWVLMANEGVAAVKVEVLARKLEVSRGSFYWHFKNRRELLEEILKRWESETLWLIEESQKETTPETRLVKLFALGEELCDLPDPETAILTWANQEPAIQERVRIVETKRVDYLNQLLQDYGFNEIEARHKAEIGYFAFMGFWERSERDKIFDLSMKDFGKFLLDLLLSPVKERKN
ncbi:TetR/AcrR family transcriptional regulator [Pleurocapsa sp. CCALA 161]|uniref:TetR/AcrR family transcriptional regulator n=1 Tax=Pleurocapsa sp. CCALA 161 TaxID=2107688 RepID=UPI000D062256|nr:TetR/AcrR family transcriptional regulator [Pleurocapsa sp. CCALA 161]PSB10025.1 TetR/AcrR family transcriptional regulator [Pleurocapsa sp. CCALA 161]